MPRRRRESGRRPRNATSGWSATTSHPSSATAAHIAPREHLDRLYPTWSTAACQRGPLASKTVYDVHVVIRSALRHATSCRLVDGNVASSPSTTTDMRSRPSPEIWTMNNSPVPRRHDPPALHPALHLAATTGMRRGETRRAALGRLAARHPPALHRPQPSKHRRSRRRDPDQDRRQPTLHRPRPQHRTHPPRLAATPTGRRAPADTGDPMFTNTVGEPMHPESITQLFDRQVARLGLPRIRFHDLRHTHASLLVAAGTPIKVVSERLGHAHPGSRWPPTNTCCPAWAPPGPRLRRLTGAGHAPAR